MSSFFIYGRYRLPMIIPLTLLGTVTIETLYTRVIKQRFSLLIGSIFAIFFMGWLFYGKVSDSPPPNESLERGNVYLCYVKEALRFENLDKLDQALNSYRIAVQVCPNLFKAHYELGIILLRQGKSEEALRKFMEVLEINPKYASTYNNIGVIYAKYRKHDEKAIGYYKKAITYDPNDSLFYINLGVSQIKLGFKDDAIDSFRRAIQLDPKNKRPKELLQRIYNSTPPHRSVN